MGVGRRGGPFFARENTKIRTGGNSFVFPVFKIGGFLPFLLFFWAVFHIKNIEGCIFCGGAAVFPSWANLPVFFYFLRGGKKKTLDWGQSLKGFFGPSKKQELWLPKV